MLHHESRENVLPEMKVVRGFMIVRRRQSIIDGDHRSRRGDAEGEGPALESDGERIVEQTEPLEDAHCRGEVHGSARRVIDLRFRFEQRYCDALTRKSERSEEADRAGTHYNDTFTLLHGTPHRARSHSASLDMNATMLEA